MSLMNHVAGSQCLLEMDTIFKSLHIPYFLMQGTALGAHRDGGFVPNEKDIDLGVLYENLAPKIPELMVHLLARRFDIEVFQMPFSRPKTVVAFKEYEGHVVHVDIVGMVKWRDMRFTSCPVRSYIEEAYCIVHQAEIVENYRQTRELWGRKFNIPQLIDHYLMCEYGTRWREPRDDHLSRTRVYNFIEREQIPHDYLEQWYDV